MCLIREGKQAGGNEEKTKKSKSVEGRKDSEMVKGQQDVLCGGNVRREQRSRTCWRRLVPGSLSS